MNLLLSMISTQAGPLSPDQPFGQLMSMVLLILGVGVLHLIDRLLVKTYPRGAWGSWLCGCWVGATIVAAIQLVLGTLKYGARLSSSLLLFGIPTIIYALALVALIYKLLPDPHESRDKIPPGFVLDEFVKNTKYNYACLFLLACIPIAMASSAFDERFTSGPQILRYILVLCSIVGYYVPGAKLRIHWGVGIVGCLATLGIFALENA